MLSACSINKVILMGRLTADPELRQTPSGQSNCRFTVAVDRGINPSTNERQTDFITVYAWDKNAEFVSRYMTKGRLILVEGNLKTGSYDDRNHPDVKHFTCDVYAERISFGETKSSQGGGSYAPQQFAQPQQSRSVQQSGYDAPPAQNVPDAPFSLGSLDDFGEVIGVDEKDLPF